MGNQVSLALAGGVKVLNPTPVDPRMRVDSLTDITNDATYYVGFSPIYVTSSNLTYFVASGTSTAGWEFTEISSGGSTGGDKHFRFSQGTSTDFWEIPHNLKKRPSVVVTDSAGSEMIGSVEYIDDDNLTIEFSSAFKGIAYLN